MRPAVATKAARIFGSRVTSLRMFGSNEIVPPLPFTVSIAFLIISTI